MVISSPQHQQQVIAVDNPVSVSGVAVEEQEEARLPSEVVVAEMIAPPPVGLRTQEEAHLEDAPVGVLETVQGQHVLQPDVHGEKNEQIASQEEQQEELGSVLVVAAAVSAATAVTTASAVADPQHHAEEQKSNNNDENNSNTISRSNDSIANNDSTSTIDILKDDEKKNQLSSFLSKSRIDCMVQQCYDTILQQQQSNKYQRLLTSTRRISSTPVTEEKQKEGAKNKRKRPYMLIPTNRVLSFQDNNNSSSTIPRSSDTSTNLYCLSPSPSSSYFHVQQRLYTSSNKNNNNKTETQQEGPPMSKSLIASNMINPTSSTATSSSKVPMIIMQNTNLVESNPQFHHPQQQQQQEMVSVPQHNAYTFIRFHQYRMEDEKDLTFVPHLEQYHTSSNKNQSAVVDNAVAGGRNTKIIPNKNNDKVVEGLHDDSDNNKNNNINNSFHDVNNTSKYNNNNDTLHHQSHDDIEEKKNRNEGRKYKKKIAMKSPQKQSFPIVGTKPMALFVTPHNQDRDVVSSKEQGSSTYRNDTCSSKSTTTNNNSNISNYNHKKKIVKNTKITDPVVVDNEDLFYFHNTQYLEQLVHTGPEYREQQMYDVVDQVYQQCYEQIQVQHEELVRITPGSSDDNNNGGGTTHNNDTKHTLKNNDKKQQQQQQQSVLELQSKDIQVLAPNGRYIELTFYPYIHVMLQKLSQLSGLGYLHLRQRFYDDKKVTATTTTKGGGNTTTTTTANNTITINSSISTIKSNGMTQKQHSHQQQPYQKSSVDDTNKNDATTSSANHEEINPYLKGIDSFRNLFCRLCYQYDCNVHGNIEAKPDWRFQEQLALWHDDLEETKANNNKAKQRVAPQSLFQARVNDNIEGFGAGVEPMDQPLSTKDDNVGRNAGINNDIRNNNENIDYIDKSNIDDVFPYSPFTDFHRATCHRMFLIHRGNIDQMSISMRVSRNQVAQYVKEQQYQFPEVIQPPVGLSSKLAAAAAASSSSPIAAAAASSFVGGTLASRSKKGKAYYSVRNYDHKWCNAFQKAGQTASATLTPLFDPCVHEGLCNPENCSCIQNHWFCTVACCWGRLSPNFFRGCDCKAGCSTSSCTCYDLGRECDPDLCLCDTCGVTVRGSSTDLSVIRASPLTLLEQLRSTPAQRCKNDNILMQRGTPHLLVSASPVSGWGGYTKHALKRGDFITEYTGELVSLEEGSRRGLIDDARSRSYIFTLCANYEVDAHYKGNISRFINHSSHTPNCKARVMFVRGVQRIGLFAKQDIPAQSELFFDYRYDESINSYFICKPALSVDWMKSDHAGTSKGTGDNKRPGTNSRPSSRGSSTKNKKQKRRL